MEDFIDNKYHQSTFNKFRDDIINQVMLKVKSTEVKDNYDKLITHFEDEIAFLRKELHSRDSLIELLIKDNKKHLPISREDLKNKDIENTLEVKYSYNFVQDINKQNTTSDNEVVDNIEVIKKRDGKQRKNNRSTCILGQRAYSVIVH